MIPKFYHTVWLGEQIPENEKNLISKNCYILKNYKFFIWNNENYNFLKCNYKTKKFINFCLENKKYAFASDVIKLLALFQYGGWSLDSDVEVFRPFDDLLNYKWVSGFERYKKRISPITAVWGAIPEHNFTKLLLNFYEKNEFNEIIKIPNTKWISSILFDSGVVNDNSRQRSEKYDVDIFPDYFFCGPKKEETYSIHHFKGSWLKK